MNAVCCVHPPERSALLLAVLFVLGILLRLVLLILLGLVLLILLTGLFHSGVSPLLGVFAHSLHGRDEKYTARGCENAQKLIKLLCVL